MTMPATIFQDTEKLLVDAITTSLAERSESYAQGVVVATKKPGPEIQPYPSKVVVVRSDGGPKLDWVRKMSRVGISIWCDTYADAADLSTLLEALSITWTNDHIKSCNVILSPVRAKEPSEQEARYMTLEVIIKGSNL